VIIYLKSPSKTAILYLKTTDGGTELKINNEIKFIKDEENKMLIFDSDVQHRGIVSKDSDFRYLINFNYFE
jgi:sulfur transfer complex TusBCD TusB component (DsrH family)